VASAAKEDDVLRFWKHLGYAAALLLLIAWVVAGIVELYRNKNASDHPARQGEE